MKANLAALGVAPKRDQRLFGILLPAPQWLGRKRVAGYGVSWC